MRALGVLALSVFALGGCSVQIPEGVFACQSDQDCPAEWRCRSDHRCYKTGAGEADATVGQDAMGNRDATGGEDALLSTDATGSPDGTADQDAIVPSDAGFADALDLPDAGPGMDALSRPDVGFGMDALGGPDAGPGMDALDPDTGAEDTGGMCVPEVGQPCLLAGACGAHINCAGVCSGGTTAPSCSCGPASCQVDGTWSCPDPANFGQSCSDSTTCGGAIDCSGACVGGQHRPMCQCPSALTCQANGQWSACSDPPNVGARCDTQTQCGGAIGCGGTCEGGDVRPNCPCSTPVCQPSGQWSGCMTPMGYGQTCDTAQLCGGTFDCNLNCVGGTPPTPCQVCGTPTCDGCVGGICGSNSTCTGGLCLCDAPPQDQCSCGTAGVSCAGCDASGTEIIGCTVDEYNCGVVTSRTACPFGCVNAMCECSPLMGTTCGSGLCRCNCGTFPHSGAVDCDGSCILDSCTQICIDNCNL